MTITRGFPSNSESSRDNRHQRLANTLPVLIPDDTDCCKVLAADVVCGGRQRQSFAHHPGNRGFRKMIATKKPVYQTAKTKDDRASIVEEAMETVRNSGGRFLRQKNGKLTEIEDGLARELVQKSFEFRDLKPWEHHRVTTSRGATLLRNLRASLLCRKRFHGVCFEW